MSKKKKKAHSNRIALSVIGLSIVLAVAGWLLYANGMVSSLQVGAVVGAAVGAAMWPVVQNPSASNLTVYGAAAGLLGMTLYEVGSLMFKLQGSSALWTNTGFIGSTAYEAIFRIVYVAVGAAILGSLFSSPENAAIGLVMGLCLGGALAGLALPFLASQGVAFSLPVTRLVLGFFLALIFAAFASQ